MESSVLVAAQEPQQAVIGWLFVLILLFLIFAQIADWIQRATRPPPPPPFVAPPITPLEQTAIAHRQQQQEVEELAGKRPAGWPYRAALTLLESQLVVLRERFNRLLVTSYAQSFPKQLAWSQYKEYRNQRYEELRRKLAELSGHFTRGLGAACETQDLRAVKEAVNQITRDCAWIFAWAADQYQYRAEGGNAPARPVWARTAEHIFRQVEALVGDLRRAVGAPHFTGPLLFRAEFYIPDDSEVDKPVLAVITPPKNTPE
jgi:hypothetical protein